MVSGVDKALLLSFGRGRESCRGLIRVLVTLKSVGSDDGDVRMRCNISQLGDTDTLQHAPSTSTISQHSRGFRC